MNYYITSPADYWIAPNAVSISLNARGNKDRIQCGVASGAVIMCFVEGIKAESAGGETGNGDGLWYDTNHEPKRWQLSISPTYFDTQTRKYIYAAIPRSSSVGVVAVIVFPSEKLDIYGRVKREEDGVVTYEQVGSEDYFYVYLQGIISDSISRDARVWEQQITNWGSLGTAQGNNDKLVEGEWYRWSTVSQTVTFLKKIIMDAGSQFMNLRLRDHNLIGVATADTGEEYVDSETLVVTPSYLQNKYLSKKNDDEAEGLIGFLKGIWIGIKDKWGINENGDTVLHDINANDVQAVSVQADDIKSSDYSGEGIADTGFRLFKTASGYSKLVVDELYVRIKAIFESLEVKKEVVTGGNQVFSCAANVISRTDYYDSNNQILGYSTTRVPYVVKGLALALPNAIARRILGRYRTVRVNLSDTSSIAYIRCYFLAEEGGRKVNNLWSVTGGHDLARCQTFNLDQSERESFVNGNNTKQGNVFWWRKVIAVSTTPVEIDGKKYHYFDVSMSERWHDGNIDSDLPCAGDEVSQWGNDANTDRMNLKVIEVNGSDAPADKWYRGIYTFDMNKCYFGGSPRKDMISAASGVEFYGPSFKVVTENGIAPVPYDIDVDWASQTKSRAEYAETGIAVGDLIVKNYYYDRVPHNGSLWLCTYDANAYWARYAKFENGTVTYVTEDVFNTLDDSKKLYVRVDSRTGLNDNQVCRRRPYTSAEPTSLSGDWLKQVEKGANGIDAQDVEWAFIRTKTNVAPVILNDSAYTDSNGHTYTSDEHLPHVTGNDNIENNEGNYECTDDPKGIDDTWKYEWEIKRSKGAASDGHRAWEPYSGTMTLHGNYAESAFIIDTDNDNDQFGTDSESKVLVQQVRQTVVSLYDGATQQTLTALSATLTYEDGTSVPSGVAEVAKTLATGVVAVTVKQNSTANTHSEIRANITATCAKGSKQTVFTLRKVMGGAPGLNPIIYQLAPTQKTLSFSRTSTNSLTPSSRSSQINVAKTEGNTTTILSSAQTGITYEWGFDTSSTAEETSKAVGSSISVTKAQAAIHYQVWIKLSTGDRETMPIVKDGNNGAKGDTPMQAFQWNSSPTTAPSPLPSGATLGDWSSTAPSRPSSAGEHYLWMTETVKHTAADGTVTYDSWSSATRVSGEDGDNGEDAVNIVVSPASLLVNQGLNDPTNLSNLTQTFVVAVYKGDVEQTVGGLSFRSEQDGNVYKALFLNDGGQRSGNSSVQGNILTLKQINTYQVTEGTTTRNVYYDSMYVDVTAEYGNSQHITARVRIYANLLGTWAEKVEGDMKTELANSSLFKIDPQTGKIVEEENWGEFYRSSTENTSRITKQINDGKNLLKGVLTGDGWKTGSNNADVTLDSNGWFVANGVGGNSFKSPSFGVENGNTITLSFWADTISSINVVFNRGGNTSTIGTTYDSTTQRHKVSYTPAADGTCFVVISTAKIYHPQVEVGSTPTQFDASADEEESIMRQTSSGIEMRVNSKINALNMISLLNWTDASNNVQTADVKMGKAGEANSLFSPQMYLDAGTYTFSGYFNGFLAKLITRNTATGTATTTNITPIATTEVWNGKTRYYFTFTLSAAKYVNINLYIPAQGSTALYRPQLEKGSEVSAYVPCGDSIGSTGYAEIKANEVNTGVRDDLGQVGIHINGTNKSITAIGEKFSWENNNNEQILGMDSNGNAMFAGTVRAKNFYHRLSVVEFMIGQTDYDQCVSLYITNATEFKADAQTLGFLSEVSDVQTGDVLVWDAEHYPLGVQNGQRFDGSRPCTGDADEVVFISVKSGTAYGTLYLPPAASCVGKLVTVHNKHYSGYGITVYSADTTNEEISGNGYVNNSGNFVIDSSHPGQGFSVNASTSQSFLAVSNGWLAL